MEQAIGLVLEIFGPAAIVALATALIITWLGQVFLAPELAQRFVFPCALAVGYLAGYLALPRSFAGLMPEPGRAWPWLPYLGLFSGSIGMALPKSGRLLCSFMALLAIALVAAALSPTWTVYGFSRIPLALFLGLYLLAVSRALQLYPRNPCGRRTVYFLAAVCVLNALVIGAVCSVRLAQLAALVAAGFTGISFALFWGSKVPEIALKRLSPLFATLVAGIAWLACIDPDPPEPMLLIIPLFTWLLWLPLAIPRLPSARDQMG